MQALESVGSRSRRDVGCRVGGFVIIKGNVGVMEEDAGLDDACMPRWPGNDNGRVQVGVEHVRGFDTMVYCFLTFGLVFVSHQVHLAIFLA